jgi:hypothetical protein
VTSRTGSILLSASLTMDVLLIPPWSDFRRGR